jgi:hypothetical protein
MLMSTCENKFGNSANFKMQILITPSKSQEENATCADNALDNLYGFSPADWNREHSCPGLGAPLSSRAERDVLSFLYTGNTALERFAPQKLISDASSILSNGKDPLSLLNQHFQPPEIKIISEPITVMDRVEIFPAEETSLAEGNILKDLGF